MNYKRISNGHIYNFPSPMYIEWDGIPGYLVESNNELYHFYSSDDVICMQCVTQYFIKL